MDSKLRKQMTMNKAHHPRASVDRLYLKRNVGGRGLKEIEETYSLSITRLAAYLQAQPKDSPLATVLEKDNNRGNRSLLSTAKDCMSKVGLCLTPHLTGAPPPVYAQDVKTRLQSALETTRINNQVQMPLHGQFQQNASQGHVHTERTWAWLKSSNLKAETEGFLMAAQDQCLPTKYYKTKITSQLSDSKCRLCGRSDEHINHILLACPSLVNTEYLHRHDRIGLYLHWSICKNYNIDVVKNWYNHEPSAVVSNDMVTVMWDMPVHTDRTIRANRPDIIVRDKESNICYVIDMAVPADNNISEKKVEKLSKYKDLEIEIARMWGMTVVVIPVVIGALGTIQNGTQEYMAQIPAKHLNLAEIQKIALLGSSHILRKALSITSI